MVWARYGPVRPAHPLARGGQAAELDPVGGSWPRGTRSKATAQGIVGISGARLRVGNWARYGLRSIPVKRPFKRDVAPPIHTGILTFWRRFVALVNTHKTRPVRRRCAN